jgi:protocatechuate 3,4-dioxygenase beta subunit/polyisoprenoid-binding protein YceI
MTTPERRVTYSVIYSKLGNHYNILIYSKSNLNICWLRYDTGINNLFRGREGMTAKRLIFPAVLMILAALIVVGCAPAAATQTSAPAAVETVPQAAQATVEETAPQATQTLVQESTPEQAQPAAGGILFTIVPGESEARYIIREQLANRDLPNDAVGKTDQVSGSITLNADGSIDPASQFTVDVSTLVSDQNMRDNYVRRNILQTDQYPTVTFKPASVSGLANPLPTSGPVQFEITGDLTIRDVTKPVTWTVTGNADGDRASGTAATSFTFADFNLPQPRVPVVLSVVDNITLEVDMATERSPSGQAGESVPVTSEGAEAQTPEAGSAPAELAVSCTAPADLTPAQTEGPYFTPNSPEDASLFEDGMPGTRMVLEGYVLTADCTPLANAKVDFWQADANGVYDNQGYRLRGHQFTDENGYYRLETVVPGEYPGRTPHIHVKVTPPGGPELTSQVYFPGAAGNMSDGIFNPAALVTVVSEGEGSMHAAFNFIVQAQ